MDEQKQFCLKMLKNLREEVNWEIEEERRGFFRKFHVLVKNWFGELPNLRDFFSPEEIESIIVESMRNKDDPDRIDDDFSFIKFVIDTGYKDEPKLDKDGKPLVNRKTPLHHAVTNYCYVIPGLFNIYDRFDVNYADESGYTHFHAACMLPHCVEVVERFLELGQDPNCLTSETGDSPLLIAADSENERVVELLLENGADPNLAAKDGITPLHCISFSYNEQMVMKFFKINNDKHQPLLINAQNYLGSTPLHCATECGFYETVKLLLRKGANPNLVNEKGWTPLHFICRRDDDSEYFAKIFFEINDEKHQMVEVNAPDKLGRTPLQLAVTNLQPLTAEILLSRGADMSCIVFPTEIQFPEGFDLEFKDNWLNIKFRLVSGALAVVECLEKRGYQLYRSNAMNIMKLFAENGFFEMPANIQKRWYDDEQFAEKAKNNMLNKNLSLYDVVQLKPEEVEKRLTCSDYFAFACYDDFTDLPEGTKEACAVHLSEIMARRFFREWALESLLKLTRYKLPILCCEVIINKLMNKDLYSVCFAHTSINL
ncbi:ankyrin-3-like [Trichogramma pretiosum]|uniref:ankyrin-3-like n=1 Tax=Trichogramma pretiosum TaxID=7493 RepID=UPI000C71BB10|nr:ankyrin-3-like [Trichogramma pretiosum]